MTGQGLLAVVAYAAVLELGQIFIPGRVASLADFAASSAGAVLGITLGLMIRYSPAATGHERTTVSHPADGRP
jgi:VanZ family protein